MIFGFCTPSKCNDKNVLQHSPVFYDVLHGRAPQVSYNVSGKPYNMVYYLRFGIYPKWASSISAVSLPQTPKHWLFSQHEEGVRIDVERVFAVLQACFAIIQ